MDLDHAKETIRRMAQLQDELNSIIDPKWKSNGWDFRRAVWMECAELVDHLGWKWWANSPPDMDERIAHLDRETCDRVAIEIVDIWHFAISRFLVYSNPDTLANSDMSIQFAMAAEQGGDYGKKRGQDPLNHTRRSYLRIVEGLVVHAAASETATIGVSTLATRLLDLTLPFMTTGHLSHVYVQKCVLNVFRQKHGYRSGSYRKVWSDGREDNDHMQDIVRRLESEAGDNAAFSERLVSELERAYQEQAGQPYRVGDKHV